MWDDPTGTRKGFKTCVHLSYVADQLMSTQDVYDVTDGRAIPNPGTRYVNNNGVWNALESNNRWNRPSSDPSLAESYIPVTPMSTDDLGKCVFDAYNKFINGVRALDASVSIAEIREIPRLLEMWQRRRAAPSNIVNGFLGYSFGWKPVLSDLLAISKELRSAGAAVRRRLKAIGDGHVVRHFKFDLSETVNDLTNVYSNIHTWPAYAWSRRVRDIQTADKSRMVVVTIRAKVKPKLGPEGQRILNQLGALGLVPSLATLWSVTRLSFVVDWFYNIGGAIENLQGSITHDISDVKICVSDTRTRTLVYRAENTTGYNSQLVAEVRQKYYSRQIAPRVPYVPSLMLPRRSMQYVLLGLLSLTNTKRGKLILRTLDRTPLSRGVSQKITAALDKLSPRKRKELLRAYQTYIPNLRKVR